MSLRKRNKGRDKYGPMFKQEAIIDRTLAIIDHTQNIIAESGPEVIMSRSGGKAYAIQAKETDILIKKNIKQLIERQMDPINQPGYVGWDIANSDKDKTALVICGADGVNRIVDVTGMQPGEIKSVINLYGSII